MSSDRRTFEKYQSQTEDAWDAGDDVESDFIHMTHDVKISRKDVKRTAMQVLSKHYEQTAHLAQTHTSALKSSPPSVVKLPTITKTTLASTTNSTDSTKNGTKSIPSKCVESPRPRYNGVGPGLGMRLMGQRSGLRQVSKLISPDDAPLTSEQIARLERFSTLLFNGTCDIEELRKQSWAGIPTTCRAVTWKILSGLVPPMPERRTMTLQRKRNEYDNFVNQYFPTRTQSINEECFRQIHIDVPRMSPLIALFQQQKVQEIFERILFIWAIRHPASGYVQGINDLVTPFFVVFLSEYVDEDCDLEYYPVEKMSANDLKSLEADCFWCFTKLLDGIQNNYTFAQPGIQENVNSLKKLISRIDADLSEHLLQHNVEYLQFAFRWMNNLLMREMSLHCIIRLWDTYLAEKNGFASFHVYVCAAFLMQFSAQIKKETDFQSIMMLLQCFPTQHWSEVQICEILAEAYKLQFIFAGAPKHTKP